MEIDDSGTELGILVPPAYDEDFEIKILSNGGSMNLTVPVLQGQSPLVSGSDFYDLEHYVTSDVNLLNDRFTTARTSNIFSRPPDLPSKLYIGAKSLLRRSNAVIPVA